MLFLQARAIDIDDLSVLQNILLLGWSFGTGSRPGRWCGDGVGHLVKDARSGQRGTEHTNGPGCALKKSAPTRIPRRHFVERIFVSVCQCKLPSPKARTS